MNPAPSPFEKPLSNGAHKKPSFDEPPSLSPSPPPPPPPPPESSPITEYILASIYPATLLLASAFYVLSPSQATQPSYFSHKRNLVNVLFVKFGWFWTTLVFLLHTSRLRSSAKSKAVLRWVLATLWWIAVTQWFFGPPIMDRAFTITGGACEGIEDRSCIVRYGDMYRTSWECKNEGGKWIGGHDLSGHVFLLTHASLFLWSELLPTLRTGGWSGFHTGAVAGLLCMWWWMLLMTGIYFHTWKEKTTGLVVAVMQWGTLYVWALRSIPQIRAALGAPGV